MTELQQDHFPIQIATTFITQNLDSDIPISPIEEPVLDLAILEKELTAPSTKSTPIELYQYWQSQLELLETNKEAHDLTWKILIKLTVLSKLAFGPMSLDYFNNKAKLAQLYLSRGCYELAWSHAESAFDISLSLPTSISHHETLINLRFCAAYGLGFKKRFKEAFQQIKKIQHDLHPIEHDSRDRELTACKNLFFNHRSGPITRVVREP